MKISIAENNETGLDHADIKSIIQDSATILNLTENKEIEILFVGKNEITELNKKHRQKNEPTDVLSFPQTQIPGEENILGSIVICPEIVSQKNENMIDVLKHGLLHLAGFDHEEDEGEWEGIAEKIGCGL